MKLKDFDYNLPKGLIAQKPVKPRDHSRLLVLDKRTGKTEDKHFYDIVDFLKKGDVLVLNDSKVFPARLIGKKEETGGKIEVFLLKRVNPPYPPLRKGAGEIWECLMGGHGRKEGLEIEFGRNLKAKVLSREENGNWLVQFNQRGKKFMDTVYEIGLTPLPPYIKRKPKVETGSKVESPKSKVSDKISYQTVYANDKHVGSVAAPTAGLHFTPALLKKIKDKGVGIVYVTLHVGLGTFAPVKEEKIEEHKMHPEYVSVSKEAANKVFNAKLSGRRIIAVGTTSARTLESLTQFSISNFQFSNNFQLNNFKKDLSFLTEIFIYPGYKFKIVDAMITNFHLPKSTLLMLVSAFAGRENILKAYRHAIKKKYHFYSYGDAMFIE